jgi:hypothetical protein
MGCPFALHHFELANSRLTLWQINFRTSVSRADLMMLDCCVSLNPKLIQSTNEEFLSLSYTLNQHSIGHCKTGPCGLTLFDFADAGMPRLNNLLKFEA